MQMRGMPQSSFTQQFLINFGQFQSISSQQQVAFSVTPTAATTPVQPSNNSSNQGKNSFNMRDPYIENEQWTKHFTLLYDCILIFTIGSIVLNRFIKIIAFLNAISSTVCCIF